ncbi:MAG: DNA modification methylase, partial [Candidatus Brocadiaceae bacterium]|nr:DNA modification methylase [Candidatus Brocadiaceae bacterium]
MLNWTSKTIQILELKEYEHNPRRIGKKEFEKLVSSIKQDGYHQRIIVNHDNIIIGGHQRKKALLEAGLKESDTLEVLVPDRKLTQEELDRINIRDNLSFGEYDFEILANRFDTETLVDFGMSGDMLVGFGDDNLLADLEDNTESEELPTEPKAKLGDVYILGNHRLMCGDSTNPQHVDKLLNGANPILMVTDPPYGVNYNPEWREEVDKGARNTGKVLNDDRYDWSEAYSLFTGDVAYVWHSALYTHKFAQNLADNGFDLVSLIIWNKQHFVLSRGDYHNKHEPLWYAVRKGQKHNWQGRRDQTTVWDIDNNNYGAKAKEEQTGHGTQKPLECMLRPILNNSKKGQSVYDPFGGSGTTLIACQKSDRNCYMMELSPAYVDIIINRWEKET